MTTLADYQQAAKQFAVYPPEHERDYLALGLMAEAGEVAGVFAKVLRGDYVTDEQVRNELGDCCWFVVMIANLYGVDLAIYSYETSNPTVSAVETLIETALSCATRVTHEHGAPAVQWDIYHLLGIVEYLARTSGGYTLTDVLDANLAKLSSRQQRGVLRGSGDER